MLTSALTTVLAQRPLGLIFDIDGTLSPIAPTPEGARLYPGVAQLLQRARQYARIAIVTGRAINSGAAMVNVEGVTYFGTHGLEYCDGLPTADNVRIAPEALEYVEPGRFLLDLAEEKLASLPGIIIERKCVGGSVHYRLCSDPEQMRASILALLDEPAQRVRMQLREGKFVIEVRPPVAIDKGWALRWFQQSQGLQGIIFAGDDRTDLDAVREIMRYQRAGMAARAIVVEHRDTLPELRESADVVVQEVEGMARLLQEMVEILEQREH